MADTVVTRTGWGQRLGNSLVGSCVGILVLGGGLTLMGWNEYRTIETTRIVAAGKKAVNEVGCSTTGNKVLDNELVHVMCDLGQVPSLIDTHDGTKWAEEKTVWLHKHAEYFAWEEHEDCQETKGNDGSTTKVCKYTYAQKWLNTANMHEPKNPKDLGRHSNANLNKVIGDDTVLFADSMPGVPDPMLGPYDLNSTLVNQLTDPKAIVTNPTCPQKEGHHCLICFTRPQPSPPGPPPPGPPPPPSSDVAAGSRTRSA